jgi:protein arginine kinase activator
MKCDQCDLEATVHELRVVGGKKVERHLCERCARKQGIAVQPQAVPVAEMLEKIIQQQASIPKVQPGAVGPARSSVCPACGTTYAQFRETGLLGCPECYRAFEGQLGPLLERAHEGGSAHAGKSPRRASTGSPRAAAHPEIARAARAEAQQASPEAAAARISALRAQLEEAVKAEQYEKAAKLRDELRNLETGGADAAGPARKP